MSNCIKDLYDYDLVKKCSKCRNISLKSNFHKNEKSKNSLFSQCKSCVHQKQKIYDCENRGRIINRNKDYYLKNRDQINENHKKYKKENRDKINLHTKNRRDLDLKFKLACKLRSRTSMAFKSQNVRKLNRTFDLLGCSQSFFQRWIIHQLYGSMTVENYGSVWQIDHCLPIASFNLLDENDMKKYFNWINLRPMYSKENNSKNDKIDHSLCLLQEVKAKYFLKTNNDREGFN